MGPNEALLLRIDALEEKLDYNRVYLDEKIDSGFKHIDEIMSIRVQNIDSRFVKNDEDHKYFFKQIDSFKNFKYQTYGAIALLMTVVPYIWGKYF